MQYINSVTFYLSNQTITHRFASAIEINKTGRQTFTLKQEDSHESHLVTE